MELCKCGHLKKEHEEIADKVLAGKLVCMHTDDPANLKVTCKCMNFEPAGA